MQKTSLMVRYQTDNGTALSITADDVRRTLCPNANDKEIEMFLRLCEGQRLNPFLKEVYLIKYGDNSPASMVTGKDTFVKRMTGHADCAGFQCGVIVKAADKIEYRDGSLTLDGEILIGGWSKIYRKGWTHPLIKTVSLKEYAKPGKNGRATNWDTIPATMIQKVALVQGARETFPDALGGLYDADEITPGGVAELDARPVHIESVKSEPEPQPEAWIMTADTVHAVTSAAKKNGFTKLQFLADVYANWPECVVYDAAGKPEKVDFAKITETVYSEMMARYAVREPIPTPAGKVEAPKSRF